MWVEVFLLLFGEEVFFGSGWMFLILGGCAQTSHILSSLERGDLRYFFLFGNGGLSGLFPLWRGEFWTLFSCW